MFLQLHEKILHIGLFMEPEVAERLLLSSLKTPEHLTMLGRKFNLDRTKFPYYPQVAEFLWDYITQYGSAPNAELFKGEFPDFDLSPPQEFNYISEKYFEVHLTSVANSHFYTAQKVLLESPREAVPFLISRLQNLIQSEDQHQTVLDARDPVNRLEAYRMRRDSATNESKFLTGVAPLDSRGVCFMKGQIAMILADTKVGKSYLALKIAAANYFENRKIVIVSPELSLPELEMRSDVILGRSLGYDLSYNAIEIGQAGPNEDTYEEFLKEWQGQDRKDWQIINSAGNVGLISADEISAIATQTKPDVLVVDGIYQMSLPSHARSIWEGAEANVYALKNIAVQNDCLVIITHQTNREGAKAEGVPSHTDVAHGYGVNRGLDYLLALGPSDVSPLARDIRVPLRRNGEAIMESFSIQFDPDKGLIGDLAVSDFATLSFDDVD